MLLFLIENRDRLIEKEEILDAIWNGTHVTENALTREIGKLRKIPGDDPKAPKYIQTVHTRGYRFIAELNETNGEAPAAIAKLLNVEEKIPPEPFHEPAPVEAAAAPALESTGAVAAKRNRSYRLITTVITIAIGLGVMGGIVRRKQRSAHVQPSPAVAGNSVAVLPFKTSVAGEEYLGFELADALVNRLSNSTNLTVSPITAAPSLWRGSQDPRTIGAQIKVDYVCS